MKAYPSTAEGWMTFLLGRDASTTDLEALESWRLENPAQGRELELLRQGWDAAAGLIDLDPSSAGESATESADVVPFPSRSGSMLMRLAAALVVVSGLALLWGRVTEVPTEFRTAKGEQRMLTFVDGTEVQLNTGTVLSVSADEQRVEIQNGEAFFDVTPQGRETFNVIAGRVDIRVVGTEFNVLRRPDGRVLVSVPEGEVALHLPTEDSPNMVLLPVLAGQAVEIPASGLEARYLSDPSELRRVEAWRAGKIELDRTPLVDAVSELSRYTPLDVEITDPALESIPVSGVFRIDRMADVDSLIFALESSLSVAARRRDGKLKIFSAS